MSYDDFPASGQNGKVYPFQNEAGIRELLRESGGDGIFLVYMRLSAKHTYPTPIYDVRTTKKGIVQVRAIGSGKWYTVVSRLYLA